MDTDTLLDAVAEIVREQVSELRRDAEHQIAEARAAADAANQRAEKLAQDLEAAAALALEQRTPGVSEEDARRVAEGVVYQAQSTLAESLDVAARYEQTMWQSRFDALQERTAELEQRTPGVTAEYVRGEAERAAQAAADAVERKLDGFEPRLEVIGASAERFDEKLAALEQRPAGMTSDAVRRCAEEAAREAEVRAGEAAELAVDAVDARLGAVEGQVSKVAEDVEQRAVAAHLELEKLSNELKDAQVALSGVQSEADAKAVYDGMAERLDALQGRISGAEEQEIERVREIADAQDQIKLTNDEVVTKAIAQMRSSVHGAEAWKRGGAGYQKFSVVRHRGALWQTPVETGEEPGRGDDWALLADGVRDVRTSVSDDGVFTLAIDTASGQTSEAQFQLPKVNFVGVYDKAAKYKKWDAMIRDGHTFLALKNDPGEVGIDNGGWMTIGYRGKAGKRGPTLDEACDELRPGVVRALMGEMPEMVSTAVQALRET
jgi:hypothetical protein